MLLENCRSLSQCLHFNVYFFLFHAVRGKVATSYSRCTQHITIVLIIGISTMVNGTLLNFGKRCEDDLRVIFDQWQKLHLGVDAQSNQKILKGIKCLLPTLI